MKHSIKQNDIVFDSVDFDVRKMGCEYSHFTANCFQHINLIYRCINR